MNIQNWKKKKNQSQFSLWNSRTTQEREKIELRNGEETKNDNERERAYRFVEVEAWGEERKNVKKKKRNCIFGFVYRFQKKGGLFTFFFF